MPVQNSSILNSVLWTQRDSASGEVTAIDSGEIDYSLRFASGTGTSKVSTVHYQTGYINAGSSVQFNLHSLSRPLFGATIVTNFTGGLIKVINIENLTSGHDLQFLTTGSNCFSGMMLGGSGLNIYGLSCLSMINNSGFAISNNRFFYLRNVSPTGINYQLTILG